MKKRIFFYLITLLFACSSKAGLVGVDLSYKHLQDREYKITLIHYFDCTSEKFDSIQDCYILTKESGGFFQKLNLIRSSVKDTNISQPVVCAGNRDNCIKRVMFIANVSLPTMNGGYEIVWKSKLKLPELKNVVSDPSQNFMLTAFVPQLARDNYNSLTEFISFPFKSICLNQTLNYPLHAVDAEEDSVVYSMSLPYIYNRATNAHPSNTGASPVPESLPNSSQSHIGLTKPEENPIFPFTKMELNDGYTVNNPIHASEFSIDSRTGLVKIKPIETGKYMLFFISTEYRKKNILSEHQVIYFFNVEN